MPSYRFATESVRWVHRNIFLQTFTHWNHSDLYIIRIMCGASIPAGLHSFAIVDKKYGVFFNRSIFDNVGSMMYVDMSARTTNVSRAVRDEK